MGEMPWMLLVAEHMPHGHMHLFGLLRPCSSGWNVVVAVWNSLAEVKKKEGPAIRRLAGMGMGALGQLACMCCDAHRQKRVQGQA